jgi:hypothetical protein
MDLPAMISPAEQYRKTAAECIQSAQAMNDPANRAAMLEMAQNWMRLAELASRGGPDQTSSRSRFDGALAG